MLFRSQVLHDQGRLPVRVMMLIRIFESDFSRASLPDLGLTAGFGDSQLWFGGAKISVDGATSSRSPRSPPWPSSTR